MTITDTTGTYEPAGNVVEALARCIADVRAVGKDGFNKEQKYNFRGVDAVVNAVHPVLALHRVVVVPHAAVPRYTPVTSKSGSAGRIVDLELTYRVYGPGGPQDFIDAVVFGEAADYGDKATAKAFSVGYRICLLQLMNLPTDDPDPDAGAAFEHVSQRTAQAAAVPDEPRELGEARTRVQAAWNFQFGPWNKEQGEALYTKVVGGVLTEATAGDLRKFAAYLSSLPARDAGSTPDTAPAPADEGGVRPVSDEKLSKRDNAHMFVMFEKLGMKEDRQGQLTYLSRTLGRDIKSRSEVMQGDWPAVRNALTYDVDLVKQTGEVPKDVSGPAPAAQSADGESRVPAGPDTQ